MVKSDWWYDNWYLKYITNDVYSMIFLSLVAFLRIQNYKNPLFYLIWLFLAYYELFIILWRGESFHSPYPIILYKGDIYNIIVLYYARLGYPWNINILLLLI